MGFWKTLFDLLFGDTPAPSQRPTHNYGQFCTDAEAVAARAAIDRLVDEFLARCYESGRVGNENLERPKDVALGHLPVRTSVGLRGTGRGWRFVRNGQYGLYVQNDGTWCFVGCHTWREPPGAPTVELSLWRLWRGDGWSDIHQHERYNVAETATGTPQAALQGFQEAIARWERRPYPTPLR